jgi:hypothetical protein
VITLRALFYTVCRLWMLVFDAVAHHTVLAYLITGRVTVKLRVVFYFWCPHDVEVRALIIFMYDSAYFFVILMCSLKFRPMSRVSPTILGFLTVGMCELFILRSSVTLWIVVGRQISWHILPYKLSMTAVKWKNEDIP